MTTTQFKDLNIGDVILAKSGLVLTIVNIEEAIIFFTAETTGTRIHQSSASNFGYAHHISRYSPSVIKSLGKPRTMS